MRPLFALSGAALIEFHVKILQRKNKGADVQNRYSKQLLRIGVFVLFLNQATNSLAEDPIGAGRIYAEVDSPAVFFEQGPVIFNTSMPKDGSAHYFTDNSGFESGPTAVFERDLNGVRQLDLNGAKIPADVHVTPDGQQLYFVDFGDSPSRIYRCEKTEDGWSEPQAVTELDLPGGSGFPTSTESGMLYFTSEGDIFRYNGREISRLPRTVNSPGDEHDPFIAQDGQFLIVVREDAEGDSNMYLSLWEGETWSNAEKLPEPFNSSKVDGSPYVTPDRKYLFFSSNRDGETLRTWQVPFSDFIENKLYPQPSTDERVLRYFKTVLWPRAYREQDVELLDRLLGDRFQMIDGEGNRSTKQKELEWVAENAWNPGPFEYRIERLEIFDGDTAIIDGTGVAENYSYKSSNVLIKKYGQWRAVASHVSGYRERTD